MGQLPKETNYWEEAEEFFSKNKENITPGTTVIFKEKIIDVKSNFDDKAFIDLVMKVSQDGETFSLIPLLYNDEFEAKNPDIKPKAISMTEYFNDDMDRSFMAEIRLGDFTEDIIRLKEHYNIPLSKQEGDYLEEILGDSLDEADITDIVPEEELVVAPDDISSIDTPTNVVDDTPKQSNILDNITRELGGVDYVEFYTRKNNDKFPSVGVNVDANGNIIIFRATDDPNRLINSNFKQISSNSGTSGMGQQNYFSTDFLYSKEYSYRENNKIYGFNTNIKPEEILQLNKTLNDYPDLAKALQPQSIFTKPEYKNKPIHYLISQQMNISPEIWNKNIPIIKSLGYKAIGTPITGQPHNYGVNYEIIPLIDDNKNVEIIPISEIKYRGVNPETDKMLNAYDRESYEVVKLDTPTNVVDDFKLSGTMGGNTTPTGVNIAYANVEDLEQFIQFDRKAEGNLEKINEIKKTILDKGYLYDTGYEGGVVFGVTVDELGNVQIQEANHRLQALIDVAKETGQEIYVPINPILRGTSDGNKVQLTSSDNAYNSMKQLLTDMLEDNKDFDLERTISEKLGEPGRRIAQLDSYTEPGGRSGTSTTQSNIKKFFNSIGLNTITYDELPDNNIYKTGVNTLKDTPTNVVDEIKSTMIGYENQVKAFKNLDKNVIGELPVEKNSELFSQNILERPDSISYDEFIKNYPVEELGPIPFYEGTGDTLTPDDWLREQSGTGYQLKEGVTPEEFRKSLDNFIEQIDNPHIKEGLLSRYRKYDKLSEGIIDQTVKSRILGAVNQDVFYDVIAFNDDLYTTKKTEDMAIVFDGWTEPTPFEDMALAEMEDWDWVLDEQGNKVEPIDPRKNIQGMDEYDKKLNQYYKYYTEEITDTPTNVVDNVAKQVDVQDVRIYFNEAYNKFNEEYMPWNYFEKFLINEKELSEDVAKGIIDDIKVGLTKPEFTNFPQSTFDPNLFPKAGTNFDSAVSRNMFNSSQVQRELSSKYILENVEDYFNLSNEQSTKLANTFYEGINPRTTGTIEFYVQQQSPNRILAGDIKSGLDMTHQIPGFYTEPIGNRSLSAIRGVGSNAPINNYYKVQVNTDNLLVDIAPARFAGTQGPLVSEGDNVLGRQINKINWDTFTKETGITYEMLGPRAKIIDGQKYYTGSVQDFSRSLNTFQPNRNITGTTSTLSKGNVWEALRKSGIEGFVSGPVNVQYEIVFLDPNDNLGIGKRMNIQDTTVQEFQSNKAAVSQLDELVIEQKPITNLNTYNQEDLNKLGGGNQLIDESKVTQLDETTNAFKTQSNDIVQKLPIEKEVKEKIAKNIARLQVRWGTWSGPLELLDIYETAVMLFYGVVAAAPELKSYSNTLMKDMYNTMIEFSGMENYGLKKLSGSDYEPNWSYIGEQVDKAEKILPSEMFIEAIKEYGEPLKNISHRGFIPVIDTRKKLETTLTNPKTPEKEDTGPSTYDKIKDTIGEWWKKPIVVYDR